MLSLRRLRRSPATFPCSVTSPYYLVTLTGLGALVALIRLGRLMALATLVAAAALAGFVAAALYNARCNPLLKSFQLQVQMPHRVFTSFPNDLAIITYKWIRRSCAHLTVGTLRL